MTRKADFNAVSDTERATLNEIAATRQTLDAAA